MFRWLRRVFEGPAEQDERDPYAEYGEEVANDPANTGDYGEIPVKWTDPGYVEPLPDKKNRGRVR